MNAQPVFPTVTSISRELLMEYEQDSNSLAYYKDFVHGIAARLAVTVSFLLDGVDEEDE